VTARVLALLPAAAVCLAEAAWIAVVAGVWSAAAPGGPPAFGLWGLAAFVGLGLGVARSPRIRATGRATLIVAVVAGLAGVMAGAAAGLGSSAASTGIGAFGALAVWRGSRHGDPNSDDDVTSALLRVGVPGLAIPWLIGAAGSANRDAFIAAALPATLLFVAASLVAVGLTRLEALSAESGLDWASNRAWLFLLGGVVAGLALVSVPATLLLGAPVGEVVRGMLAPFAAAVDVVGSVVAGGLAAAGVAPAPPADPATVGPSPRLSLPPWGPIALSLLALGVVVVGAVAAAAWRGRGARRDAPVAPRVREERHVELHLPRLALPSLPWSRLRVIRRRPDSVTGAYLATLDGLARRDLGRAGDESPRAHARRLRDAVGWRLGFLAADYELERYGARTVTPRERRRALLRARWLRR
jgi:hypothetical protein